MAVNPIHSLIFCWFVARFTTCRCPWRWQCMPQFTSQYATVLTARHYAAHWKIISYFTISYFTAAPSPVTDDHFHFEKYWYDHWSNAVSDECR